MTGKKPTLVHITTPLDGHTPEKCQKDHDRLMDSRDAEGRIPHELNPGEEGECRCTTEPLPNRPWDWKRHEGRKELGLPPYA